jgi:thiosulfate reductase cytochrome b subunit
MLQSAIMHALYRVAQASRCKTMQQPALLKVLLELLPLWLLTDLAILCLNTVLGRQVVGFACMIAGWSLQAAACDVVISSTKQQQNSFNALGHCREHMPASMHLQGAA